MSILLPICIGIVGAVQVVKIENKTVFNNPESAWVQCQKRSFSDRQEEKVDPVVIEHLEPDLVPSEPSSDVVKEQTPEPKKIEDLTAKDSIVCQSTGYYSLYPNMVPEGKALSIDKKSVEIEDQDLDVETPEKQSQYRYEILDKVIGVDMYDTHTEVFLDRQPGLEIENTCKF